jgi:uncharacterized membrane protein YvbJ
MKNCPNCGLGNPPNAQRCDCGYDFDSMTVKESYLSSKDKLNLLHYKPDIPTIIIKAVAFILTLIPFIFLAAMIKESHPQRLTILFAIVVAWIVAGRAESIAMRYRNTIIKQNNGNESNNSKQLKGSE